MKYETMFIVKSDLSSEKKEVLFKDIADIITKNDGKVINQKIWADKAKLAFSIKKQEEGTYYLMQFDINPLNITKLKQLWRLNEDILRFLILRMDSK